MKLIDMLKKPIYFGLFLVLSILMFFVYSYVQIIGIIENFFFWLGVSPPLYIVSLVLFSLLFGLAVSFQIFIRKETKVCKTSKGIKGAGASGVGTIGFIFVSSCPACATLGLVFIPVSFVSVIAQYNWLINLVSIGLLLFTLNYLGAFKN
jgi:hypothetical protein